MLFISDAQIFQLSDPRALVGALRNAFQGDTVAPDRMHCALPGDSPATLLVMPAWRDRQAIGVKVVTAIPENALRGRPTVDGGYILLDGQTGALRTVLAASALTLVRTAAVAALGADLLSRQDSRTLLMVGTGALAPHLIRAHAAIRPIERVLVWGRSLKKARGVAAGIGAPHIVAEAAPDLNEAVARADIVSCATLSEAPLVLGRYVRPGTHVDLVGSYRPSMREADNDLFRAARVVVDTRAALIESGDIIGPIEAGLLEQDVPDLALALARGVRREAADEVTVFKAVGVALADLAVAEHLAGLAPPASSLRGY
ncbi:ornithine cyclodeaminase family protein [Phenylobacterium montanum]|uniref:Ornithine cyclodeaminase family protein n=1 Tax=Phenylobacterium montanum TaxID=2823693 RepID=A0A975G1A2_9CAUL|nr:ornithine cyclodeaminase family protein [Caulobacter sp. S6]QUD89278.1 ornithine cyclodeaminase family protein [Caulobacter sp. S6]